MADKSLFSRVQQFAASIRQGSGQRLFRLLSTSILRLPPWILTVLLALLAVVGNTLTVPLFYSVQFIFGSIFVLIAIRTLGPWPAIFVAIAGALYTRGLWGHYYASIVFMLECLFVLAFCRKTGRSLFLADSIYWCLLGMPATVVLYHFALDINLQTTFVMAIKQMLNGVFNAAVACLMLSIFYLFQNRVSPSYLSSMQIRAIIFHTVLMIALLSGTFPILKHADYRQQTQARETEHVLSESLHTVASFIRNNPDYRQAEWYGLLASLPSGTYVERKPLHASAAIDGPRAEGSRSSGVPETQYKVELVRPENEPSIIRSWQAGSFQLSGFIETDPPEEVVVSRSARRISEEMDAASLDFLSYLVGLLVLSVLVSHAMSNLLTRPIWRLSTLINTSANGIITTDTEGRVEWVNAGFTRLSGYGLDELRGKKPGDFLQGADTDPATVSRVREHLHNQEAFEEELLNYRKDGHPYWIRINCEPLRTESGQLSGFLAVETDITEQRKITHLENVGTEALERIAEGGSVEDTMVALARSVESLIPGIRCAIKLSSSWLDGLCDLHPACYLDVSGPSFRNYRFLETVCPDILDAERMPVGRLKIYYMPGGNPSQNDCEVFKRAANIVSVVIERYHAEYKLTEAAGVFRHAKEGIFIADGAGFVVDCNSAFTGITGLEPEDVRGRAVGELLSEMEAVSEPVLERGVPAPSQAPISDFWIRHKNGRTSCVRRSVSLVKGKQGQIHRYVYIFNDISELKAYQSQLESMAKFDPLTKLPNRALLSDRLQQAMINCDRNCAGLAVLFIDLDGFKEVNDRHGHAFGDELLKVLASRLRTVMREGDTLARFGGDEFVMVAPLDADIKSCQVVLERMLKAVARENRIMGTPVRLTASIGATFYPQSENLDAEQLLRQADQAMYSAKQSGKNQYSFFDADSERAVRDLFHELRRVEEALKLDEFVLHYQPKVDLKTGDVIGVEALIRWLHPVRGLLGPGEFLPVTERHPLSVGLGEWVIRSALEQMQEWQNLGITLPVSVNIDPFHLVRPDFAERLADLLSQYPAIPPADLEIEIVETSSLENFQAVNAVIGQCRDLGVRFGLDDFGTGYSSLTYLRQLPLDYLKIDMSFVRGMLDNPDDLAIVRGVLGLADSLKLPVIAEGVETSRHRDTLVELGCHFGQGYWMSRPISGDEMATWIVQWRGFAVAVPEEPVSLK